MRRIMLLVLGVVLWCSCATDDDTNPNEAAFVVDTMYAHIIVPSDHPCEPPCAETDFVVRYMFRRLGGTIDWISFHPLESGASWIKYMDYLTPIPPNIWQANSTTNSHFPDVFQGVDTSQVEVKLGGAFWGTGGLNPYQVTYYGNFTFADTLIVPIERP